MLAVIRYKIEVLGKFPKEIFKIRKIERKQKEKVLAFFWLHEEYMIYQIYELIGENAKILEPDGKEEKLIDIFEQEKMKQEALELIKGILEGLIDVYKFLHKGIIKKNLKKNAQN